MPGGCGDVAGLIGRHLTGLGGRPNEPEPVPQIQRITDQTCCRPVGDAQHTAQFGGGEIPYCRGALPAQLDGVFSTGQPAVHHPLAGMQVGPMRGNLEPADLGGDQGVFVGLRSSQGASRIQLHQISFEHTFNIRSWSATPAPIRRVTANGQHHVDPDNT